VFVAFYVAVLLPALVGLLFLLGAVRVWRLNRIDAMFMMLFWPFGLYALVRYWREPAGNPRLPLLGAFTLAVLWAAFLVWGMHYQPPEHLAEEAQTAPPPAPVPEADDDPQSRLRRVVALSNLASRSGRIELAGARAAIEVPAHFRFIDRAALATLQDEDAPGTDTLGWLVHDSVDLGAADAWHVEVEWIGDGYVPVNDFALRPPATLLAGAQAVWKRLSGVLGVGATLVAYADPPALLRNDGATWVEEFAAQDGGDEHRLDCYAARLGRRGALLYSIGDVAASRRELCLRSVRLLAGRTGYAHGETYADRSGVTDRKAAYDLAGLVTGANRLPR